MNAASIQKHFEEKAEIAYKEGYNSKNGFYTRPFRVYFYFKNEPEAPYL